MENNKFHVLVVDDDNKIRDLIKQFLNENDFIVSTAANAEQAKMKMDIFNFNLMILDVMMPGQDGYELTKEIKESRNTPIILLTAKGEAEHRIHGLGLGADDYLGKPFEPQELLLRIKNIIKKNIAPDILASSKIGNAELNLNKMTIKLYDKIQKINSTEKKVLLKMLASPGKIFSRTEIGKISQISKEIQEYEKNKELALFVQKFLKYIELINNFTSWLIEKNKNSKDDVSAACNDYLKVLGYLGLAHSWLKIIKVSYDKYDTNKSFFEDKINTATYYFDKILPRAQSHYLSAITGSKSMMKANFN